MTGEFDIDWVRSRMPGRRIEYFQRTLSTMTEAEALLREGCPSGTVAVAGEQTAGQGRLGRSWYSESGVGLYASVVLRLPPRIAQSPVVTLALGLATVDAIALAAGLQCDLRWPNDVLARGRKCAGVLAQSCAGGLVAGIGINANHRQFPASVGNVATSLRIVTGREQSRELLLLALLESIDRRTAAMERSGTDVIVREFARRSSYVCGRRVVVEDGGRRLTGSTEGLDPAGFLILRTDSGARELIVSGGVRPLEG